jgi:hypothetical protein
MTAERGLSARPQISVSVVTYNSDSVPSPSSGFYRGDFLWTT